MDASRKANRMELSPTTFAKLGEIRAKSPERSSEAAYAQQAAARAASQAVTEPHPFQGDGPECALCLRGRDARWHG